MHDVFISHSSQDKPMVERLARALQQEGLKPWFDKWDLAPGDRWQKALERAILDTPALLVCYGPSGSGPWQAEEVRAFVDRAVKDPSRRVIPAWLPDCPENLEIPLFLRGFHAMDLRGSWDGRVIEGLARAILDGRPLPPGPISTIPCPYRGLKVFEEEHARWMFGRASVRSPTYWGICGRDRGSWCSSGPPVPASPPWCGRGWCPRCAPAS